VDLGLADYGFALQTAKGSPVASATFRVPAAGGTLQPVTEYATQGLTTPNALDGSGYVARASAQGDVVVFPRPSPLGLLLYGALGAKSVSGASDPWTHTFTPAITKPWLTFWRGLGGTLFERYADCKIAKLVIAGKAGAPLTVTASIVGITARRRTSAQSATIDTSIPFLHSDGQGALLLNGAASSRVDDWRLTIDTGCHLEDGINAMTVVDGTMSVIFDVARISPDTGFYDGQHYGNTAPADNTDATTALFSFTGFDLTFTRVATTRTLRLEASRTELISPPSFQPNPSHPTARDEMSFRVYDGGVTPTIRATLKNAVSAY
jgi:Phage tail tube protein